MDLKKRRALFEKLDHDMPMIYAPKVRDHMLSETQYYVDEPEDVDAYNAEFSKGNSAADEDTWLDIAGETDDDIRLTKSPKGIMRRGVGNARKTFGEPDV